MHFGRYNDPLSRTNRSHRNRLSKHSRSRLACNNFLSRNRSIHLLCRKGKGARKRGCSIDFSRQKSRAVTAKHRRPGSRTAVPPVNRAKVLDCFQSRFEAGVCLTQSVRLPRVVWSQDSCCRQFCRLSVPIQRHVLGLESLLLDSAVDM
jgi:hypothetical protein